MRSVVLAAVLFSGCGLVGTHITRRLFSSNLAGKWEGKCSVIVKQQPWDYLVELDIQNGRGGDVKGKADVRVKNMEFGSDSDVRSDVRGKWVDFNIEIKNPKGEFPLHIDLEGEMHGDKMDGACEVCMACFHFTGDFELHRKD